VSGQGSVLDLSMLDVMAYFDFPDLCQDRTFLEPAPQRNLGRSRPGILETQDGFIAVAPVSGRQIGGAVEAVGHPEWRQELREAGSPSELTQLLYDRLEKMTIENTTAHWIERFHAHDVPAIPVLTVDQHFDDPQTLHNEIYSEAQSPVGPVRRVRYPLRVNGRVLPPLGPAPKLEGVTTLPDSSSTP
jgi:crotonobetainyl-CoA:carnitine CoA-transferase CaiB-like acyl-CoA transferase